MQLQHNKLVILKKAIASSMVSKAISFLYQIISLPILLAFLGTENFALYSTLVALLGWIFLISGGINPGVTRIIARRGMTSVSNRFIRAAKKINLILILVFLILLFIFYLVSNKSTIYIFPLYDVYVLLLFCFPIIYFSLTDSIRQGIGEQHYNNLWTSFATLMSVLFICLLPFLNVDTQHLIKLIIIIIYCPLLVSKLANTYFFRKKYYVALNKTYRAKVHNIRLYKYLSIFALSNLLIQLSVIINKSIVMVVLVNFNLVETAKMELIFRFFMLAGTFFATIQQPLWPLITQAIKNKDSSWVKNVNRKLFSFFFLYSLLVFTLVILSGEWAFTFWSSGVLSFNNQELVLISLYFVTIALNQASIIMLMGYGSFSFIGKSLLAESLLLVLLLSFGLFEFNFLGIMQALLLARLLTSTIALFIGARQQGKIYA